MDITIYHNPACSKSRETLKLMLNAGIEPTVIDYMKNPPDEATLASLVEQMGISVKDLMRQNEELFKTLGLGSDATSDEDRLTAMAEHPKLINRPVVVALAGAKICRPPELVLELIEASR
ncbi:arsenate reductase (glutaredoxin) [Allohahella marinimesophila]|uniref:Arsenate reductase n=1 Tax=Allohahella marinimesophila TaxID=1054972 RepID=A0ABP7Q2E0_9GAMM